MPQQAIDKNKEYQHLAGLQSDVADLIERVKRLEAARPPPQEQYLSQQEAAALIGVQSATLTNWRHFGKGPPYTKIGKRVFYRKPDIETWFDSFAVVPMPKETAA